MWTINKNKCLAQNLDFITFTMSKICQNFVSAVQGNGFAKKVTILTLVYQKESILHKVKYAQKLPTFPKFFKWGERRSFVGKIIRQCSSSSKRLINVQNWIIWSFQLFPKI